METVTCPRCGQRGDNRPGLRLGEYEDLAATFVGDQPVPNPQQLTCLACGHQWAVRRGSVQVTKAPKGA